MEHRVSHTRSMETSSHPSLHALFSCFAGSGRWVDILTIALGQASEGKWYVSTMELQLASFSACVACRGVHTLCVTVGLHMPLSLWGGDDSSYDSSNATETRRLPGLRAAGVAWGMPPTYLVPVLVEAALLRHATWMKRDCIISKTAYLSFTGDVESPPERLLHSPMSYFKALRTFSGREDHPMDRLQSQCSLSWPPALRKLSVAFVVHEHIDWLSLPCTLERLSLGGTFDEPIDSVAWPVLLKRLALGDCFDQPIADVVWPTSLLHLAFGEVFNQPITDVAWPVSLLRLAFGQLFSLPVVGVVWPSSLLQLTFEGTFMRSLTDVVRPSSLHELALGDTIPNAVASVVWPASLVRLRLGGSFDEPITQVS